MSVAVMKRGTQAKGRKAPSISGMVSSIKSKFKSEPKRGGSGKISGLTPADYKDIEAKKAKILSRVAAANKDK